MYAYFGNRMYLTKYKTERCHGFLNGKCKSGENCRFAHSENELIEAWAKLRLQLSQQYFLVDETAEDYRKITLPYIQSKEKDLLWIYRILNHRAEQNRIVFEDPDPRIGFVLIPPRYYDPRSLHLLAIVRQCGIKSIRDLTEEDIPLLENIYHKSSQVIKEELGFEPYHLKFFFHYQPSYYHLHVHIQLNENDFDEDEERDVMLEDVIENLYYSSDFYKNATLRFIEKEGELLEQFRNAGKRLQLFKK
uniref:C3H1-type domain-containing protein n=1 Tax=Acrobeloides nanus TaxID=290746 RepID=A0A914ED09_9BILA